jgi:hypothetical protein
LREASFAAPVFFETAPGSSLKREPSEWLSFLLVHFLWTSKENEQIKKSQAI